MPRLFIGSFLSDDERARLSRIAACNQHLSGLWHKKVRWTEDERLHLTWLYMGEYDDQAAAAVRETFQERLAALGKEPIEATTISYDHMALWPSPRKARTGVLTASVIPPMVQEIESLVRANMRDILPPGDRKWDEFQPHLTIFRIDHPRLSQEDEGLPQRPTLQAVKLEAGVLPVVHALDEVCLLESDLGKKTRGYIPLSSIRLQTR